MLYGDRAANIFLLERFLGTRDPPVLGHDHSRFPAWFPDCLVDIVVGFDISTHLLGQPLFLGHPQLESSLPGILEDITSIRGVSCGRGAEVQVSVAFKVNSNLEFPVKFQIYQKTVFDSLQQVTVNGPTHLNAEFLQSLWDTFEDKSASRGQVSTAHSVSHLHSPSFVSPSQLCISFSHHPLLCFPLSLGASHLFRWSWR